MKRIRGRIGWPEILFAGVVLGAFLVVGAILGHISVVLTTCSTSRCQPYEPRVDFNLVAGLVSGLVASLALVALGAFRDRRTG